MAWLLGSGGRRVTATCRLPGRLVAAPPRRGRCAHAWRRQNEWSLCSVSLLPLPCRSGARAGTHGSSAFRRFRRAPAWHSSIHPIATRASRTSSWVGSPALAGPQPLAPSRSRTPITTGDDGFLDLERVHEGDDVDRRRRRLAVPEGGIRKEPG